LHARTLRVEPQGIGNFIALSFAAVTMALPCQSGICLPAQALFSHFLGTLQAACTPVQLGTGSDYRRIHPGAQARPLSWTLSGLEPLERWLHGGGACGQATVALCLLPKASAWDHACGTFMRRCQSG